MKKLSADTTLYVRADGSDSNDGLSDSAIGAFKSLQHAYDSVADNIFLGGHKLTIRLGVGSFEGLVTSRGIVGGGYADDMVIEGAGDQTVVVPQPGAAGCFYFGESGTGNVILTVASMTLSAPQGYGILAFGGAIGVHYREINFEACGANHINAAHNAWVYQVGPCKISGGAMSHLVASTNAVVAAHGSTIDVASPASFPNGFVSVSGGGRAYPWPLSGSGLQNITGLKFSISPGSAIDGGGNIHNLPGNLPGVNNGGWYT